MTRILCPLPSPSSAALSSLSEKSTCPKVVAPVLLLLRFSTTITHITRSTPVPQHSYNMSASDQQNKDIIAEQVRARSSILPALFSQL